MDRLEAISVDLTTEEMVVLLEELGFEEYAGLDTSALDELSARERALVIDVARRGLVARRVLVPDEEGGWQVSQLPLAAVGVSLAPSRTIVVASGGRQGDADSFLFHTDQDVFVTHNAIADGGHRFLLVRNEATWREAILSAAGVGPETGEDGKANGRIEIRRSLLEGAREASRQGDPAGVVAYLRRGGIDPEPAERLGTALTGSFNLATVVAIDHREEVEPVEMTVLAGGGNCWRLELASVDGEETILSLRPLLAGEAQRQLLALVS